MRSPWKLVAGLVSRAKPEQTDRFEEEISASPVLAAPLPLSHHSSDQETGDQRDGLAPVEAPHGLGSTQGAEEAQLEPTPTAARSEKQATAAEVTMPTSGPAWNSEVKSEVATIIRLVPTNRLAAHEELSEPKRVSKSPDANASVVSIKAKSRESEKQLTVTASESKTNLARGTSAKNSSPAFAPTNGRTIEQRNATVERPDPTAKRRATKTTPIPESASPERMFIAEIRLNDEINDLRHELVQKLRLQNEQLKAMLARYDNH